MLLSDLLDELREVGAGVVGQWELNQRKGVLIGDPKKFFPHPTGPQVPVDCTKTNNPDIPNEQVKAIRRKFGIEEA